MVWREEAVSSLTALLIDRGPSTSTERSRPAADLAMSVTPVVVVVAIGHLLLVHAFAPEQTPNTTAVPAKRSGKQ
jgi:hypothetical protein